MTDIENEAETIPLLSVKSTRSENRSRTASFVDNLGVGIQTSISPVTPTVVTKINDIDNDIPLFSIRQIYKNLIILSFSFLLFVTASYGIQVLQSSLNAKGNVGVNSLIITNVFLLFGSIFLTSIIIDIFGLKWTIVISVIAYISYIIANIRPTPTFMYITGAFTGIVATPLWTSQGNYINTIARYYAHHTQKKVADIVSSFYGIFFGIYGTMSIWGNLISYLIINQSNHTQNLNCGVYFDPLSKSDTDESVYVSDLTLYVLCGVFAGMSVLSMILLFFFVDQIRLTKTQPVVQSLKKSVDLIQSLFRWKNIDQFFLLPLIIWSMLENTFLTVQFTRAFVTCLVGIRFIGLVLICNGVCNAIFSYIFGSLVKYIGRLGCFIIAASLSYTTIIFMYFWDPLEDQMYILFIISGVWGIADSIWQSQVYAAYTVLYADTDSSALAKFHLWKGIGGLATYSYASYITMELTLIILFSFLTISMICYFIVEIHFRRKK